MARQVEIHHLDIGQGDSTLILVKEMTPPVTVQKSVLIDAGLMNQGPAVLRYIKDLGLASLNIVIASHYDKDHFWGLRPVLASNKNRYDATHIYDRGEQGKVDRHGKVTVDRENQYIDYLAQARVRDPGKPANNVANTNPAKPNRRRPTTWVEKDNLQPPIPAGWAGRPDVPFTGNWWTSYQALYFGDILQIPPAHPGDVPPTLVCVAANQFVQSAHGPQYAPDGQAIDDNPFSMAWKLTFNNFTYYTAGDLPSVLEDQLGPYIGVMSAFKVSHHGASASTSQAFLNAINPTVAIISCGNHNSYGHPTADVIARLDHQASIVNYFLTSCGSDFTLIPGCNGTNQWTANTKSRVAGSNNHAGDIILTVTAAQSTQNPVNFSVRYYDEYLGNDAILNY